MYTIFGHVTRSQSIIIQLGFASNPKLLVGPCLEAQRTTKHQHDGNENGDGEYETLVTTTTDTTTTTRTTTTFVGGCITQFYAVPCRKFRRKLIFSKMTECMHLKT